MDRLIDIGLMVLLAAVIICLALGLLAYIGMIFLWIEDGYSRWNDNDDRK
jgi:hypothetical protein